MALSFSNRITLTRITQFLTWTSPSGTVSGLPSTGLAVGTPLMAVVQLPDVKVLEIDSAGSGSAQAINHVGY